MRKPQVEHFWNDTALTLALPQGTAMKHLISIMFILMTRIESMHWYWLMQNCAILFHHTFLIMKQHSNLHKCLHIRSSDNGEDLVSYIVQRFPNYLCHRRPNSYAIGHGPPFDMILSEGTPSDKMLVVRFDLELHNSLYYWWGYNSGKSMISVAFLVHSLIVLISNEWNNSEI